MKPKSLVLMGVAAVCGLVAMLGVQQVLSNRQPLAGETARVLVASTDIEPGIKLLPTNVKFRDVPIAMIPKDAVTLDEEYDERALKVPTFTGQVIVKQNLGAKGVFGTDVRIPDGMVVASVTVNEAMTHGGLLKAGDYVNVIATYTVSRPNTTPTSASKTLLQGARVWAVDDQMVGTETVDGRDVKKKENAKTVSFLVWPNQSLLLALASTKGTLALAMRGKPSGKDIIAGDIDERQLESLGADLRGDTPAESGDHHSTLSYVLQQAAASASAPEISVETPKPTFTEFLASKEETAAEPAAVKTWKIRVFSGNEERVQEVPLPEQQAAADARSPSFFGTFQTLLRSTGRSTTQPSVRSSQRDVITSEPVSKN